MTDDQAYTIGTAFGIMFWVGELVYDYRELIAWFKRSSVEAGWFKD